jgi:hypothetical protein
MPEVETAVAARPSRPFDRYNGRRKEMTSRCSTDAAFAGSGVRAATPRHGDYYELPADGLLRHERSGEGELS